MIRRKLCRPPGVGSAGTYFGGWRGRSGRFGRRTAPCAGDSGSNPLLEGNTISDSKAGGVLIFRGAGGLLRKNTVPLDKYGVPIAGGYGLKMKRMMQALDSRKAADEATAMMSFETWYR